jgi:hypothetical protein
MNKLHKLPCLPYVKKYVQADLVDNVLHVKNRPVVVNNTKHRVDAFFDRGKASQHFIYVEMRSSSLYTLYSLHGQMAREFRDRMFTVAAYAVKAGLPARSAIRKFLESYNITDDEYDLDSAYRTWERRKQRFLNPTEPVLKKKKADASLLEKTSGKQLSIFSENTHSDVCQSDSDKRISA